MGHKLAGINYRIERYMKHSGYRYKNDCIEFLIDSSVAFCILLLTLPIWPVLALIIKLQDRGPVFYRGIRYGKNKKKFYMYKFRTLIADAEAKIGAQLVNSSMNLETPIGKFLRDTRLDELPQLINVLKGDMALIGPRPERPLIYEQMCQDIPDYDLRFTIKPGLIGYSQLFTPHSTSKKFRARIDNYYSQAGFEVKNNFIFLLYAFSLLGGIALKKIIKLIEKKIVLIFQAKRFSDERKSPRIKFFLSYHARLIIYLNNSVGMGGEEKTADNGFNCFIFDINDKFISIISDAPLPTLDDSKVCTAKLMINSHDKLFERRSRQHIIRCNIIDMKEIKRSKERYSSYRYLLAYSPISDLYRYRLDKYVLKKSIL